MAKERKSGIELLRILAMIGVFILHYNNEGIGGAFSSVSGGSVNQALLFLLESICICAVNLFVLISGYFMCTGSHVDLWKPIGLIVQVIVYNLGIYALQVLYYKQGFQIGGLLSSLIPANYFVILYSVLYILSPYINCFINSMEEKEFSRFLVIVFLLFSVCPTLADVLCKFAGRDILGISTISMYGSQEGYTIVNFILMYFIGAGLRRHERSCSYGRLVLWLVGLVLAICGWSVIEPGTAWEYCNSLVIIEAVVLFRLFSKLPVKQNRAINTLAQGAFSMFLLHQIFIHRDVITEYVHKMPLMMLLHMLGLGIAVYLISWCVNWIYGKIMNPILAGCRKWITLPDISITDINRKH